MKTHKGHSVASILALAATFGAASLLQVGCLDAESERADVAGDDQDTDTARVQISGSEEAAVPRAVGTTWEDPFISVQNPPLTPGKMILDIKTPANANGDRAQLSPVGSATQAWRVTDVGAWSGFRSYILVNIRSGRCLDMATDGPVGNGTRVQQWDCNGELNQQWVAMAGSGWGLLRNRRNPDLCLDAKDATFTKDEPLQVWSCNLTPTNQAWNQHWNIYR